MSRRTLLAALPASVALAGLPTASPAFPSHRTHDGEEILRHVSAIWELLNKSLPEGCNAPEMVSLVPGRFMALAFPRDFALHGAHWKFDITAGQWVETQ
ncbi:hypothetical protein ACN2XU_14450 [Primorskyibacter sp. 2E107]